MPPRTTRHAISGQVGFAIVPLMIRAMSKEITFVCPLKALDVEFLNWNATLFHGRPNRIIDVVVESCILERREN